MNVHGQWPNVERLLVGYLTTAVGVPVFTETPADLEQKTPCLVVERIAGGYGRDYEKTFVVDVTAFATTRPAMWSLVQVAEVAMVRCDLFDTVEEQSSFGNVPYANNTLRRAVATYGVTARPQ
ncbi:hypothetical protein ACLBWP_03320 [Microbacterium sp. M1A1_1b]